MEERLLVFVSSSIKEFTAERFVVKEAIESIPLTQPWVFEYTTASSDPLVESYLGKVRKCDLFILLLGQYLTEPVLKEWQTALRTEKPRLVFLKKGLRNSNTETFIKTIDVKWAEFSNPDELKLLVQYAVTDELIKGYRRYRVQPDTVRLLKESLPGNQNSSVYIDARSGGNFFNGNTIIGGDVISGNRIKNVTKTKFHDPK